jgi:16S rRNA (uracil1498-N3)-methyltransferase
MSVTSQPTKIRLYVKHALVQGQEIALTPDQAHYLFNVMRQSVGAQVAVFNGVD